MLTKGAILLREYMGREGCTQAALAEAIEVSQGTVSRYVKGDMEPRRAAARRIQAVTRIPASAWDEPDGPPPKRPARRGRAPAKKKGRPCRSAKPA